MKIGFGKGDVTPRGGKVSLCGQYHLRITDTVLDPLYAAVMIVETAGVLSVFIAVDTLQPYRMAVQLLYPELRKILPSLREEQLMITATHIHTGPGPRLHLTGDEPEPDGVLSPEECVKFCLQGIVQAVTEAKNHLCEAYAELAVSHITTGTQRMTVFADGSIEMYGDPKRSDFRRLAGRDGGTVQILYAYRKDDGVLLGTAVNVPCTAQCDEMAEYITADYWGVVRDRVKDEWGENVVVLPLCRVSGDLSPHDILGRMASEANNGVFADRGLAVEMGNRVADAIVQSKGKTVHRFGGDVAHRQLMREISLPMWKVSEAEYCLAKEYIEHYHGEINRRAALALARIKRYESSEEAVCRTRIYAMRLDNIVVLTVPFELYIEYADRIRAALTDWNLIDVQLGYENLGYLPTEAAAVGAVDSYSANMLDGACGPDGGEVLVRKCIALCREVTE